MGISRHVYIEIPRPCSVPSKPENWLKVKKCLIQVWGCSKVRRAEKGVKESRTLENIPLVELDVELTQG